MEIPHEIQCPYCGEGQTLFIDASVRRQQYIEDCQVCCQPIELDIWVDKEGELQVTVSQGDS